MNIVATLFKIYMEEIINNYMDKTRDYIDIKKRE